METENHSFHLLLAHLHEKRDTEERIDELACFLLCFPKKQKIRELRYSLDPLIIAETKIDSTFPTSQFMIEGFMKPFRYDRNQNGGGLLIYVRERAPVKELTKYGTPNDIECGMIEINLKKQKWLLVAIYRPPSQPQQ